MNPNADDPVPVPALTPEDDALARALDQFVEAVQQGSPLSVNDWLRRQPDPVQSKGEFDIVVRLEAAAALLAHDSQPPDGGATRTVAPEPTAILTPGQELAECRIEARLGQGGMGEVYRGFHTRLHRPVAIKVIAPRWLADPAAGARFAREIEAAGRLDHPHIVRALHAGTVNGAAFLILDYVDGPTLRERVARDGPLPVEEWIRLLRQAADALAHAHERGLVHRDLKPANLMLTRDGQLKILDFGLAHLHAPQATADDLTEPGQCMGTYDYVAPEQADDARQADARSDLYSLGCTFYQLLTGRPPFAGRSALSKLQAHASEAPVPLGERRPDVPPELAAVIDRLMAKDPADRFPSAVALREALDALVPTANAARSLPGSRRPAQTGSSWNKHSTLAAASMGILVLTLALALVRWPPRAQPGSPMGPLEITAFQIRHSRHERDRSDVEQGEIGKQSFTARFNDRVRLTTTFSEPAYAYLLAFNPDGQEQRLSPARDDAIPDPVRELDYPSQAGRAFVLNDGVGMQVFVVLASRQPLPAYADWKRRRPPVAWKTIPAPRDTVWVGDGRRLDSLLPAGSQRGNEADLAGAAPVADVARQLRQGEGIEAVSVIAFAVEAEK